MRIANYQSVSFSQKVKYELSKIRERGKEYKEALSYGLSYGTKDSYDQRNRKADVENIIIDRILGGNDEICGIFLRGIFMVCGSISDPNKDYHLELVPPNDDKCRELFEFMTARGFNIKQSKRNTPESKTFLYFKECEQITDFLTCIGAVKHSMELMNIIMIKELRNKINRAVNCESANIGKTTYAALKQISDIELIMRAEAKFKKFIMTEQLREVALIRLDNIGISLNDIGKSLKIPISKSGVNHRFRKITAIATDLRANDDFKDI